MIDKAMSPMGDFNPIEDDAEGPIEIEILADDGSPRDALEEAMDALDEVSSMMDEPFDANLVEVLGEGIIGSLGDELCADFDDDMSSRNEWSKSLEEGIMLLGLQMEDRTEPWQGACGVFHPLLTESAIRFQSEMISATFPAMGPVKAKVVGYADKETEAAAKRVVDDMNHFLTDVATEFRPEHERMLFSLALFGCAFKKCYYDPKLGRPTSMFVPAEDLVVNYGATDIQTAPRVTHVMRKTANDVRRLIEAGFYTDIGDLDAPKTPVKNNIRDKIDKITGQSPVDDERFTILEMYVELNLEDEDNDEALEKPYVVTLMEHSREILAIRRNWEEDDPIFKTRVHIAKYDYIPGFGFYSFGLIHLLGNTARAATSLTRQLVDAGTLNNLPGGLKTNGLRVTGDDTPIMPGEWRSVDIASGALRDNIMPLPYKEPSQTLAALLATIVEDGRHMASTADAKLNDVNGEAPVGTTLAILERQMVVVSAIQARCYVSMGAEFKLIAELIKEFTAPEYSYPTEGTASSTMGAKREDYEKTDIIPVGDPNAATAAQRIIQYQAAIQLAQQAPPGLYKLPILHRQMLEVMGIKDADKIIETEDDLKPVDPVSENMEIIKGAPAKAFIEQNHEAHIAVHNAFVNDPKIGAQMQQNPQAQAIMAQMQAHIAEHMGFSYRQQIEQQLGISLPPPGQPLPEGYEAKIAPLLVQAAQQVNQMHASEQQQQQFQQQQQDPLFQQQQQELQLKAQEIQSKHEIELAKILSQEKIAGLKSETDLEKVLMEKESAHQLKAADILHTQQETSAQLDSTHAMKAADVAHQQRQSEHQAEQAHMMKGVDIAHQQSQSEQASKQESKQPKKEKAK